MQESLTLKLPRDDYSKTGNFPLRLVENGSFSHSSKQMIHAFFFVAKLICNKPPTLKSKNLRRASSESSVHNCFHKVFKSILVFARKSHHECT